MRLRFDSARTGEQGDWNLNSYVSALLEGLDAIASITGCDRTNAFGFCAGGITLAALLGYLASRGASRINAAGFAVTLLDWSTPSMVGMLHSETMVGLAKQRSRKKGVISGAELSRAFAWFRPNRCRQRGMADRG